MHFITLCRLLWFAFGALRPLEMNNHSPWKMSRVVVQTHTLYSETWTKIYQRRAATDIRAEGFPQSDPSSHCSDDLCEVSLTKNQLQLCQSRNNRTQALTRPYFTFPTVFCTPPKSLLPQHTTTNFAYSCNSLLEPVQAHDFLT